MKCNNKNEVLKNVNTFFIFFYFWSLIFFVIPSGNFHHRVHVFWEPEAVSKEDKEES